VSSAVLLDNGRDLGRHQPTVADVALRLEAVLDDGLEVPCRTHDPDLWFAESPAELERAKEFCRGCPVRAECLAAAQARREFCGVWGGEIVQRGVVLPRKRRPGRPRKVDASRPAGA
jgi:WhiB family redox-sensing transcriptional regulator